MLVENYTPLIYTINKHEDLRAGVHVDYTPRYLKWQRGCCSGRLNCGLRNIEAHKVFLFGQFAL
jgi:hypothetical protein